MWTHLDLTVDGSFPCVFPANSSLWTYHLVIHLCKRHIQFSRLAWKAFANAHEIVFVLRINCGPCLFPDWRNSWVSLLCSMLTLDVNDIGNHFRKHSSNRQRWKCVPHTCSESSDYLYIQAVCRESFSWPILLHQNTILSASDVQLLVSRAHNVLSFSPSLSLCLSFHFLSQYSQICAGLYATQN